MFRRNFMTFDPDRYINELLLCLNQDKKPIGLLLGAGCPFAIKTPTGDSLIPDIKGLKKKVYSNIKSTECGKLWKIIENVLKEEGVETPNIEQILSRVRGLSEYIGTDDLRGMDKSKLVNLEKKICEEIKNAMNTNLPEEITPYHQLANWIGAIQRNMPIEIFTTNYDLLMEIALEQLRIPFFDGFVGSHKPFFDPYAIEYDKLPPRWARLWKIHGSINWQTDGISVCRTNPDLCEGNLVIHPSHLKYEQSRKMPYLAMMDHLRGFLSISSGALIINGYSFGDQHLNDMLIQGLQGNPTMSAFALMYNDLENSSEVVEIAKKRGNLSVIATDGAVIGTREDNWKTESEKPDTYISQKYIDWSQSTVEKDKWEAKVRLGDFNVFGEFLQDITGKKM
jgi:hypothetical protein